MKLTLSFLLFMTIQVVHGQPNYNELQSLVNDILEAQENYDHQKVLVGKLADYLVEQKSNKAEVYGYLLSYGEKVKPATKTYYYYTAVNQSVNLVDPEYGTRFLQEGLQYVEQDNYQVLADFYGNIGVNYAVLGMDGLALDNWLKALDYIERKEVLKTNRSIWVTRMLLSNIIEMYLNQQNLPLAMKYTEHALAIQNPEPTENENKFEYLKISELNLAAEIAHYQKKDSLVTEYLEKSIEISRKLNDFEREAEAYVKRGDFIADYPTKLKFHNQAYQILKDENYPSVFKTKSALSLIKTILDILENPIKGEFQNIVKQEELWHQTQEILAELDDNFTLIRSKKDQAEVFKQMARLKSIDQDYKAALYYSEKFHHLNDSIFSQENKNKLAAIQSAGKIELLDREIELNLQTIREREKQVLFLFLGILIVTVLGAISLYQNKIIRQKNKKLDEANQIKTKFFNILNHDLRSPVGDLIRFMHLKRDNPELLDADIRHRLDQQTMHSAENLLMSMDDLLAWSIGQMKNFKPQSEKITVKALFDEVKRYFSSPTKSIISFENKENINLITDHQYLKTIMRNLTSNAIKAVANHTDPKIVWRAYMDNKSIVLSISDNGPGASADQFKALYDENVPVGISTGLGLHLVRDMAKAINGKLKVISDKVNGTTISIIFKI